MSKVLHVEDNYSLADMSRFLMVKETRVPNHYDPYASLPPQGVQHGVFLTYPFLVTHPVITPVQRGLTSRNKKKPRSRFGVSHAASYCLPLTGSSKKLPVTLYIM